MKKFSILILKITLIIVIIFIGYKGYYLNKYNTSAIESEYKNFIELFKNREQYTIKHKKISESEYIKFKNIKFKNNFKDYIKNTEFEENNYIEYRLLDKNNKINSYFSISITQPIYMTSICLNNEECFDAQAYMKKNNLLNEIDILEYSYSNQKKPNVFSNIDEIKDNYIQKHIIASEYGKENLEKIVLLDGIYNGIVVTTKNTTKIEIMKEEEKYSLFFVDTNIKDKELEDILNSLEIN